MPVRIEIEANSAWEAREEMRHLLAGEAPAANRTETNVAAVVSDLADDTPDAVSGDDAAEKRHRAEVFAAATGDMEPAAEPTEEQPQARLYGQPRPGMKKRNKAEMEEDAEIEKLAAKLGIDNPVGQVAAEAWAHLRERDDRVAEMDIPAEEPSNISTSPEDRKEPEEPAKDATRQDVIDALHKLVAKFDMNEAMAKFKEVTGYEKQSQIPDDPAEFAKVVAQIEAAL